MKPSDVLDSAANIILRDGWTQGQYYEVPDLVGASIEEATIRNEEANRSGPCCQAGAISRAVSGKAWTLGRWVREHPEARTAHARANHYMMRQVSNPVRYNDTPGRTADEVVAALRGAAELARKAGE